MPNPARASAVFVHGAGGGGWEWVFWQRVFAARGWSSHARDLLPVRDGIAATQLEDYVDQVRDWCREVERPLVLIGASLGGLLALAAAPEAAPAAIVLINPAAPAGVVSSLRRDWPDVVPWGRERSLPGTRRALPDANAATHLFAFRRWRDESGAALRSAAAGLACEKPACPVLVLASENDLDVPPETSRAVADAIDADFRMVGSASHVGVLIGRVGAATAEETWRWCERALRGGNGLVERRESKD
jgi:pimeloyl-ACP methyl ester carboxylesterase